MLLALTLFLSACASPPVTETETGTARPNFLFLFADDQWADTIGAWGNPHIETPSLDRLAAAGFSFRAHYNMGGRHGAVCQASRVMVNTGMSYFRVPDDMSGARLLPELLGDSQLVIPTYG